jgi:hypothetical protein
MQYAYISVNANRRKLGLPSLVKLKSGFRLKNRYMTLHQICDKIYKLIFIRNVFPYALRNKIRSRKPRSKTVGIRCADHATPPIREAWH